MTDFTRSNGHPATRGSQEIEPDLRSAMLGIKRGNVRMFLKATKDPLAREALN